MTTQGTGDAPVRRREPQIEMAHGAGDKASRRPIEGLFAPLLFPSTMGPLGDSAHLQISGTRVAITTDSFVVKTLSFVGGSIGELAVNHLGVSGAKTGNLDGTYAIEGGLPAQILAGEVRAMAKAATGAGVTNTAAMWMRRTASA